MKQTTRAIYVRVREIISDFRPDVISSYASGTAFYIILSFFPFMIVLLSLLQFLPFSEQTLSSLNLEFLPQEVERFLMQTVREITVDTSVAVLPIATVGTLWSASRGIYSLTKGLNIIYRRTESRHYLLVRSVCLIYTLAFIVLLLAVFTVLVFGNRLIAWLSEWFPFCDQWFFTSSWFRSLVTFLILSLFFTLLYKTVPDRKARWFGEVPGALFSALGWIVFSKLYSLYIDHFSNYANVYGSLTAVILLMVWLQACMYMLLIGAHINVTLQKHHRIGAKFRKTDA